MADRTEGKRRWHFYVEVYGTSTGALRFVAHITVQRLCRVDTDEDDDCDLVWRQERVTARRSDRKSYDAACAWAEGWIACALEVRRSFYDNDERVPLAVAIEIDPDDVETAVVANG